MVVVVVVVVVIMVVIMVVIVIVMMMTMVVVMMMVVPMAVIMGMGMPHRLAVRRYRVAAAAYRAHQITSKSLIRISSPSSGMSRPPPHKGHGSSLSSISTVLPQS